MIQVTHDGNIVKVKIEMSINYWIELSYKRNCRMDAKLLANQINNDLKSKIEKIRRDAYNLGWKDKASKKSAKKTWFNGNINSDYIG